MHTAPQLSHGQLREVEFDGTAGTLEIQTDTPASRAHRQYVSESCDVVGQPFPNPISCRGKLRPLRSSVIVVLGASLSESSAVPVFINPMSFFQ